MKKAERIVAILCLGGFLIALAFMFSTIRKQNVEKENMRLAEREKYIEQTFDVKMHRAFHDEIKYLIKTHCSPQEIE